MKHTHFSVSAPARRPLAVVVLAGVAAFGLATAGAYAATTSSVTYAAQASIFGVTGDFNVDATVTGTAPATVAPDSSLAVQLSVGSITVPSSADGYTVEQISGIALQIPVPADSTYDSAGLSGGSNLGSGTPSVSESNGVVTISVPNTIKAGTTFTLPTLTLNLTSGASGSIDTALSGTSYTSPGLTFTAEISIFGFGVSGSAVGYPTTSPTLTSTAIS